MRVLPVCDVGRLSWLARRWEDPIFPVNFPWFGTPDYWRGQVLMLQEQVEQMQEAPLNV